MNLFNEGLENRTVIRTELTRKVTIDGITKPYPVYKIRLDNLYYNDQNDRIATWISQHKAENDIESFDMTNIEEYNSIIQGYLEKSNQKKMKMTEANIELVDQREPGVVLTDGRVIDGNRRFTCLRNLAKKNPRFNYFEAVILDLNIENNAKQIKMLELMIQHGEESKVEYNPIDRLVGIYNDIINNKVLTIDEYAKSSNIDVKDLKKQIEIANLLVEFLEFINAPGKFFIAREMDLYSSLYEMPAILKSAKNDDEKEDVKNAIFLNFMMKPAGDMVRYIRKVKNVVKSSHLESYLEEQMEVAEEILDKLPEENKTSIATLNEIKSNKEVKEKLERSLEKADLRVKSSEARNKPLKVLEKVSDNLESIDTNIFKKLLANQMDDIKNELRLIKGLVQKIEEGINV